ncbi:MAG: murein hydrolase activator EnvC [Bacteroidales bacterium]
MIIGYCKYFLSIFFLILFGFLKGQTIDDLNLKRKSIEDNISKISSLIDETSKEKSLTENNLRLIERRIKLKNELISQIDKEIDFLNSRINYNQFQIDSLEDLIHNRREELAFILKTKFRNKDQAQLLMFILSSNSFNQAYTRVKFYNNLVDFQKKRIDELKELISAVNISKLNLQNNFKHLKLKQIEKESELNKLLSESNSYNTRVKDIKKKEKQLRNSLANERKKSDAIADQIKKLIEEEARKKLKNSSAVNEVNYKLAKQFKENFGKLPPPVKDGIVTSFYGENNHPYLKGVKIKNNGIDITVSKNSNVYCIFEGEVRKIFTVPLGGMAVIIRHGTYLTVYSNLSNLDVKVGDKVKTNQIIGEVSKFDEKVGILHFEVWNERNSENPTMWIPSYKSK